MIKEYARREKKLPSRNKKTEDQKLLATRDFCKVWSEDAYQSDDSHDEKMKSEKKEQKIKDKSKKIKK